MIDHWPPLWRHLALLVLGALLSWASADLIPVLSGQSGWVGAVGAVLTVLIAILTPLTRQYGVGSSDPAAVNVGAVGVATPARHRADDPTAAPDSGPPTNP